MRPENLRHYLSLHSLVGRLIPAVGIGVFKIHPIEVRHRRLRHNSRKQKIAGHNDARSQQLAAEA